MALRVQPVPAPAAGRDWSYTVPGNYQMDVKAVQATLATPFGQTTLADSSGNGWTLTTDSAPGVTYAVAGPYAGGANNYAVQGDGSTGVSQISVGHTAVNASWSLATWTVEAWLNAAAGNSAFGYNVASLLNVAPTQGWQFLYGIVAGSPTDVRLQVPSFGNHQVLNALTRSVWHHVAITWDGANFIYYRDGANIATWATPAPTTAVTLRVNVGGGSISPLFNGKLAGVAISPAALSGGQIAAHAAANSTAAAYQAAVLADSPKGLWMLNDTGNMGSRLATLEVTNGTTTVADFPGGAISNIAGSFTWTWASQAPGTNQSADATVNLVQIPDLILPGGYTIGTVTPDLGLADSWTNINIWWDDGTIGPGPPIGPASYLNRMLIPDYGNR